MRARGGPSRVLVSAVVALAVAGCAGGQASGLPSPAATRPSAVASRAPATSPTTSTAAARSRPAVPAVAGCLASGRHTLTVGGRAVLVGVPAGTAKPPLVMALAGYDQSRQDLDRVSDLVDRARARGVEAVLLEGTGSPLAWAYQPGETTDIRHAEVVLARLRPCVDLTHLVLLGFSDGGLIGMRIACALGPAVRHFVMLSANVAPEQGCALPADVRAVHGDGDPIDPYDGNDRGIPPARAAILAWAQAAGCDRPVDRTTSAGVDVRSYPPCPVALVTLAGGGHAWPDGEPSANPRAGRVFRGYDLTAVLLALARA